MFKDPEEIKQGIVQLLERATPENRRAVINLFPAAKAALESGYVPLLRREPLRTWRCLLTLLANLASMQAGADAFLHVTHELLGLADRMVPPAEALQESAELLTHLLHADLYVCRMRDKQGNWRATSASTVDESPIPLFAKSLEAGLSQHPVMRAASQRGVLYIVSNDLRSIERGGESFDCMCYRDGYRSRLAFVLRERFDDQAFGLLMFYSRMDYGFENLDELFLSRISRLVNMAVGRRISLARDTLEKAAGAMAHYGNNALNTMRVEAEYCGELVEGVDENAARALRLVRQARRSLGESSPLARGLGEAEQAIARMETGELSARIGDVVEGTKRMSRIIRSLEKSVERPRLLKYVRGVDVLRLEDGQSPDERTPSGAER